MLPRHRDIRKCVKADGLVKLALVGRLKDLHAMNACRADETDEQQCPCPFCGIAGPETEMDCIHCQNIIPFCIASGEHTPAT